MRRSCSNTKKPPWPAPPPLQQHRRGWLRDCRRRHRAAGCRAQRARRQGARAAAVHAPQLGSCVGMPSKSGSARGCTSSSGRRRRASSRRTVAVREEKTCAEGQDGSTAGRYAGGQALRGCWGAPSARSPAPLLAARICAALPAPRRASLRLMAKPSPCTSCTRLSMVSLVVLLRGGAGHGGMGSRALVGGGSAAAPHAWSRHAERT